MVLGLLRFTLTSKLIKSFGLLSYFPTSGNISINAMFRAVQGVYQNSFDKLKTKTILQLQIASFALGKLKCCCTVIPLLSELLLYSKKKFIMWCLLVYDRQCDGGACHNSYKNVSVW